MNSAAVSTSTVTLPESGLEVKVDFDPNEVLDRYAQQRELRMSSPTQRVTTKRGASADTLRTFDPYSPRIEREPLHITVDVAVLGGGFGGISAGKWLKECGIENFHIIEQGGDFGGTWYWNRYPGAQCDMQSYLYMPYLEETGYMPTLKYAGGQEIFEHAQRLGRHYDLYDHALFQTSITDIAWSDQDDLWVITTDRGDTLRAKFVIRANGPFSAPRYPNVPGIEEFEGKIIHTSRWDYDYTGGGQDQNLDKLADKRVAVIGTGATGIQVAPYLADASKSLVVVQRTPAFVAERNNAPTDPDWAASLTPGWQQRLHEDFTDQVTGLVRTEDGLQDMWTKIFRALPGHDLVDADPASLSAQDQMFLGMVADLNIADGIRARVDQFVSDPDTAEALKPWFGSLCKRPGFHDEYLPMFNRDTVSLVDAPHGLDRITAKGFIANGIEYEVDCLVFATGFETGPHTIGRDGFNITGRGGQKITDTYADGLKTLHGFFTRDFPNFIELGLSQNSFNIHYTYMIDRKARHASRLIKHALDTDIATLEPTEVGQAAWVETIRTAGELYAGYVATCTPGYYNGQGDLKQAVFREVYQIPERIFWGQIEDWWANGEFAGLDMRKRNQE
jgi:cyclohexanone monooxygenase